MTNEDDPINTAIAAYLDYVDSGRQGEPPSLDQLDPQHQQLVADIIANIDGGAEFDPTVSPPSLESLLYGGPFYDAVVDPSTVVADAERVRTELDTLFPWDVSVHCEHLGSLGDGLVLNVNGQRLRGQVRHDLTSVAELRSGDFLDSVIAVYHRHPETSGFVLMHDDVDLPSVIIDPFDPERCIEVPSGRLVEPGSRRPIMPLADAVRGFLDDAFPIFQAIDLPSSTSFSHQALDPAETEAMVSAHIGQLTAAGSRARSEAKRQGWRSLGTHDAEALTALAAAAQQGHLHPGSVGQWLDDHTPSRA